MSYSHSVRHVRDIARATLHTKVHGPTMTQQTNTMLNNTITDKPGKFITARDCPGDQVHSYRHTQMLPWYIKMRYQVRKYHIRQYHIEVLECNELPNVKNMEVTPQGLEIETPHSGLKPDRVISQIDAQRVKAIPIVQYAILLVCIPTRGAVYTARISHPCHVTCHVTYHNGAFLPMCFVKIQHLPKRVVADDITVEYKEWLHINQEGLFGETKRSSCAVQK